MANQIEVKLDHINVYELEDNDSFNYDSLPKEKQEEIDQINEKFEKTTLQQVLHDKAIPCQCMAMEIQERAIRRASLLSGGRNMPISLELTQDDIDQKDFVVVINTENGIYSDIRCIVSHCRRCGELHMWGELEPIGNLLAHCFVDHDTTQQHKKDREDRIRDMIANTPVPEDGRPQFVLENTETGEMTPADDLVRSLAGDAPLPENMTTETIAEPSTDRPVIKPSSGIILPD